MTQPSSKLVPALALPSLHNPPRPASPQMRRHAGAAIALRASSCSPPRTPPPLRANAVHPQMRHVGAAIAEMFSTGHVRMVREACRLERLLLAATYIETASRCGGRRLRVARAVGLR